ncbi:MAG: N-acetylmuramoyl-L-alanine amidase [Cyclobacteriaceae bacterium]
MYRKLYLYLSLSLLSFIVFSQEGSFTRFQSGVNQRIVSSHRVTAIALRSENYLGEQVALEVNGEDMKIPYDPDAPEFSYFRSLSNPLESVQINTDLELEIGLINSGVTPNVKSSRSRINQETCEFEIDPIPQSEWRAGLEAPSYSRSFTNVEHVIVHHSAGSNTSTNYTQIVRDIYIYHTQSNGWSDIGYNYLIAQNGALYAGRDPAGGAQDNVLGAHFCGSNSSTMGICLLGNYETAQPTSNTWETLHTLAGYKIQKEGLDPLTSSGHPLGNIGHIAGHRDGCSTACPGQNVYELLPDLRQETTEYLETCGKNLAISINPLTAEAGSIVTFTNNSSGYDEYIWLFEGGNPSYAQWQNQGDVVYVYGGVFDVTLIGVYGTEKDTTTFNNILVIKDHVEVFPNPVSVASTMHFTSDETIETVEILGLDGKLHYVKNDLEDLSIQVPPLRQGIYLVKIISRNRLTTRRVLIN